MSKALEPENICYDMKTLGKLLPIGKNKLYELVHSKGFPKITVGHRIIVPKRAFDEWLEKASSEQRIITIS